MAIETNLNQSPYFDDFDENKNFHRVLFRPGYSVQARELTQLQTILQNQVERFANEILVDGTIVTGGGLVTDYTNYVKLRDKDANNRVLLLGDFYNAGKIANVSITGETSGVTAKLVDAKEGSESAAPNYLTLYCHYTNSGSDNATKAFADNETLVLRWSANGDFKFAANTIANDATGRALKANIDEGICYHKGNFIRIPKQSIIAGKYTVTPNAHIGLTTTESLIDSNQDSSLLDNASGATNYAAPGANRLKIVPTLTVKPFGFANTESYFTIATVEEGSIVQREKHSVYSDIGKYIAERLYDTNGNFVVKPFNLRIREHLKKENSLGRYSSSDGGDAAKLVVEVEKGSGYVSGQRVDLMAARYLDVDKAANTITKDSVVVGQGFGNYVKVKEVVGQWDFQGLREIELHSSAAQGITGLDVGATASPGAQIGTARVRGFQWDSGTPGTPTAEYRIYLFDVQMNAGYSFRDVRSLYVDNSTGPKAMGDCVLNSDGDAEILERGLNNLVFPLGSKATKALKDENDNVDTRYVYRTERETSFSTSGTTTMLLSGNTAHTGGSETPWNTGNTITDVSESRNYIVVAKDTVSSANKTGQIDSISGTTIGATSGAFQTDYRVGDFITIGSNTPVRITAIASDTSLTVSDAPSTTTTPVNHQLTIVQGSIIDLEERGSIIATGTPAQVKVDLERGTFATTFSAALYFNVYRTNSVQIAKTVNKNKYININTGSHSASKTGPWPLGVIDAYKLEGVWLSSSNSAVTTSDTDVTSHFELDSGMKDAFYDTAKLVKKASSTLDVTNKAILVKFSYFAHDRSQGATFFSVDSYPTSNSSPIEASSIEWQEIPVFTSPSSGLTYDLRDHIDMRPSKVNVSTPTTTGTVAGSPTNPAECTAYETDGGFGAMMPTPDENFVCDATFYLPRKDRIMITKRGDFQVIRGVPDVFPKTPDELAGGMTLGVLTIPPFPSLSPYVAKEFNRPEYQVKLALENNRRYTMADLRGVEERVKTLEYYSSLNMLEAVTSGKQIFNDSGIDRFKNGFFVDDMGSLVRSDTTNKYYRAAIDSRLGNLRPTFDRADIKLDKDVSMTSTNVAVTGDIATLSYNEEVTWEQKYASKLRNPVGELLFNWKGAVKLDPPADNTPDITTLPDIQIDFSGYYDAIAELAEATGLLGTVYGDWEQSKVSKEEAKALADEYGIDPKYKVVTGKIREKEIVTTTMDAASQTISMGNTIENVSVREYMKEREIRFTGERLKPNTRVYAYFDDEPVSAYCTPTNNKFVDTGLEGGELVTNSNGYVYGKFRLPNDSNLKFRVGTKRFVLKDVSDTLTQGDLVTTSAHGEYTSNPLSIEMRGTEVEMKIPEFAQETTKEVQIHSRVSDGDRASWDPLAQSFSINVSGTGTDGVYMTKIDLFFGKRDEVNYLPLSLQVRDVVNGFPTRTILPYGSKTLSPKATGTVEFTNGSTTVTGTGTEFTSELHVGQVVEITDIKGSGNKGHVIVGSIVSDTEFTIDLTSDRYTTLSAAENMVTNTNQIITGSGKSLWVIPISSNGSVPTSFKFSTPVFCKNGQEYAMVALPGGNSDQYAMWVAQMGGQDAYLPNTLIDKQTYAGVLFSSSNDNTWNPIQDEDMKFTIYHAEFGTSGTLYLENEDQDYFTVSDQKGTFKIGENVRSISYLTFANTDSVSVGTVLQSKAAYDGGNITNSNFANGTVRSIESANTGSGLCTVAIDALGTFSTSSTGNANYLYIPGVGQIGTTHTFTPNTAVGVASFYNSSTGKLYVNDSTGGFSTDYVRGQKSGASCLVDSVDDLNLNSLTIKLPTLKNSRTNVTWSARTTTSSGVISSEYTAIDNGSDTAFYDTAKKVYSKSNEDSLTAVNGSKKSLVIRGKLSSTNSWVSPTIDLSRATGIVIGNIINNDSTGETGEFGNAKVRYISKQVTLSDGQDAEDLIVYLDAFKPSGSDIKVYARIIHGEDGENFTDKDYTLLRQVTASNTYSSGFNGIDLKEFEYTFSANTDGENFLGSNDDNQAKLNTNDSNIVHYRSADGSIYKGFKTFAIKIVMTSSGSEIVPLIDNLRAIALQK